MVALAACGHVDKYKVALFEPVFGGADGLHGCAGARRAAGAVKGGCPQRILGEGHQPDNILAERLSIA